MKLTVVRDERRENSDNEKAAKVLEGRRSGNGAHEHTLDQRLQRSSLGGLPPSAEVHEVDPLHLQRKRRQCASEPALERRVTHAF